MVGIGVTAATAAEMRRCPRNTNWAQILALLLAVDADEIRMMRWVVNLTRRRSSKAARRRGFAIALSSARRKTKAVAFCFSSSIF
jgi:hypothetical protein